MSLKRIKEYPTKQQFESTEDYMSGYGQVCKEEAADRIKDFDILQLANVPWYDAREFGLKVGDDTTLASGNTTALQAAIDKAAAGTGNDAGGRVLLPEGIIQYDAMITMKNKVYLCGMGRESTQLKFTGTSGYAIYFGLSTAPPVGYYHMGLQDFWLLGNASCTGGIQMYGGMYYVIERLRVSHFSLDTTKLTGHGIFFDDACWEGVFKSNFISHNNVGVLEKRNSQSAFNAVSMEGMNSFRSNNYGMILGDPDNASQTLPGGFGSIISNNAFNANVIGGLWIVDAFGLKVVDNYFEANGGFDIRVGSTEVDGNTLVTEGISIRGNAIYASDDGEIGIDIIRGKQVATFHNYIMQAAVGINIGANSDYTKLVFDFCDSSCAVNIADSGTNTTIFDQWGGGGGGAVNPMAFRRTGRCYTTWDYYQSKTFAITRNVLYAYPFIVPVSQSFDRIIVSVSTARVNGVARVGIYSDNGVYPDALIVDSGELDCSVVGYKSTVIAETLGPGLYWLAINSDGDSNITFHAMDYDNIYTMSYYAILGKDEDNFVAVPYLFWTKAEAYGALPTPFPAAGTMINNADLVTIMLRKA